MTKFKTRLLIAAAAATFSTTGFGAGAAIAQDQVQLCPEGQTYEFHYECDRETRQCVLVWQGCV
jgi:hypothetical protein